MLADALRFIRFTHTVFAMPFALGAMLVAARGLPPAKTAGLIVLAMIFARSAAMAFNRIADWEIDKRNPRTAARHQLLPKPAAIALLVLCAVAFVLTTAFINRLCLLLSPVAMVIILFYSLTKRFTHMSQLFLGLALSVSPMGAWLAVTGQWAWTPCILAAAVLAWVAGFDLIYATQDHDFDKSAGLHSGVVKLGIPGALRAAKWLHLLALVLLGVFGGVASLGVAYWSALVVIAGVLVYEHRNADGDLSAINRAFFLSNAIVGIVFLTGIAIDVLHR